MKVSTIAIILFALIVLAIAFFMHVFDALTGPLGTFYAQNETTIKLGLVAALFITVFMAIIFTFVLKRSGFMGTPQHTLSPREIIDDWRKSDPVMYAVLSKTYDIQHPKVGAFLDDTTPTPRFYMEVSKKVTGMPDKAMDFVLLFDAGAVPNPLGSNRLKVWGDKELVRVAMSAKDANDMAYRETDRSTYTDRMRELQGIAEDNPDLLPFLIPPSTTSKVTVEK